MATTEELPTASDAARTAEIERKVRETELIISTLLRVGVLLSVAIIVIGMAFTFAGHSDYFTSNAAFHRLTDDGAVFPTSPGDIFDGVAHLNGPAIVMVGLYLLILTPVMRVGVSILAFVHERDHAFVYITTFVFLVLIGSLFLGKSTGG